MRSICIVKSLEEKERRWHYHLLQDKLEFAALVMEYDEGNANESMNHLWKINQLLLIALLCYVLSVHAVTGTSGHWLNYYTQSGEV